MSNNLPNLHDQSEKTSLHPSDPLQQELSEPQQSSPAPEARIQEPAKQSGKSRITLIISAVLVVQVLLGIIVGGVLYRRAYQSSKTATSERIRKEAYDAVYSRSEQAYHVSNDISIFIDNIQEKAELEVLEVSSEYLYVSEKEGIDPSQTFWYRIPGTGTFTVNMQIAEFLTDSERQYVHVKVPQPAITQFREDFDGIQKLMFQNNSLVPFADNGSISEGEQIARDMMVKAHVQNIKHLEMNRGYYQAAETSAAQLITSMIKASNPSLSQLTVEVEFDQGIR